MKLEAIAVYLSCILYVVTALFAWRHFKKFNEVVYITCLWAFSALACAYYYDTSYYYAMVSSEINIFALFFYFACYLLLLYPLFYVNSDTINISISNDKWKILMPIIYIAIFTSLLPIVESLQEFLRHDISELGAVYEEANKDILEGVHKSYLSRLGGFLFMRFQAPLMYISPVLFFVYLRKENKKNLIAILLLISSFTYSIFSIARGQRAMITFQGLFFLYVYLLFRKGLSDELQRKVKIYLLGFFSLFIVVFLYTTLSRSNIDNVDAASNEIIYMFLGRYYGEHIVNFASMLFQANPAKWGEYAYLTQYTVERQLDFDNYLGIKNYLFYGSIGDLFKDFSYLLPLIFLFTGRALKRISPTTVGAMVLLFLWAIILVGGTFGLIYETVQSPLIAILIALFLIKSKI